VNLATGRDHQPFTVTLPITHDEAYVSFSREGLERLKRGLLAAGLDAKHFAWPPEHDPDRPPYRGLKPLERDDAGIFFGRDGPIVEVLDKLRGLRDTPPPRMLVILGASGAGKSSFMRAGLLPRRQRDTRHYRTLPVKIADDRDRALTRGILGKDPPDDFGLLRVDCPPNALVALPETVALSGSSTGCREAGSSTPPA